MSIRNSVPPKLSCLRMSRTDLAVIEDTLQAPTVAPRGRGFHVRAGRLFSRRETLVPRTQTHETFTRYPRARQSTVAYRLRGTMFVWESQGDVRSWPRGRVSEYPQSPPKFPQNSLFSLLSLVFAMRDGYKPFGCEPKACSSAPTIPATTVPNRKLVDGRRRSGARVVRRQPQGFGKRQRQVCGRSAGSTSPEIGCTFQVRSPALPPGPGAPAKKCGWCQ